MEAFRKTKREWIFGTALFLLAAVCAVLAFLQYRWIGEVATAQQQSLRQELQRNLNLVRRDFDAQLTMATALLPTEKEIEQQGRERAYLQRYLNAPEETQKYFARIALAIPLHGDLELFVLDARQKAFRKSDWPLGWAKLQEGLKSRLTARPSGGPADYRPPGVIEFPRFAVGTAADAHGQRPGEQEWLILEFDSDYLRKTVLPPLLQKYLASGGQPQYTVRVLNTADPSHEVLQWGPKIADAVSRADAWTTVFEAESAPFRRRPPSGGDELDAARNLRQEPEPPPPGHGLWTIRANHPAGSFEGIVERARRRNLILAAGLLSLLVATVVALVRFTRAAESLAAMQMSFVSGISHELRTPLSVLRAAGFALRTRFSGQPDQVVRYARLVEDESQKLTSLVEQILRYARAESGRILGDRELVGVNELVAESLPVSRQTLAESGICVEGQIAADLPFVRVDREAMTHAIRNLFENAVKHGGAPATVRINAAQTSLDGSPAIRLGIQDNGPGIPRNEREHIFEPFFRGRLAMENQIHGTGLGLNLAQRIVQAHGGTLTLSGAKVGGAEFVITLPAFHVEQQ